MFNQVSGRSSIESAGDEALAQPLTIHTPRQDHSQGDMAVQAVANSSLESIGSQALQQGTSKMQAKQLVVNEGSSCLESSAISQFIESSMRSYLNIKKLATQRGEQWGKKVNEQFDIMRANHIIQQIYHNSIAEAILEEATWLDKTELVQFLCAADLDCLPDEATRLKNFSSDRINALKISIKRGNIEIMNALIQRFPHWSEIALELAVDVANVEIVKTLLEAGHSTGSIGKALVGAVNIGDKEIFNILLKAIEKEYNSSEAFKYIGEAFVKAAQVKNLEVVRTLLKVMFEADNDEGKKYIRNALAEAVQYNICTLYVMSESPEEAANRLIKVTNRNVEIVNLFLKTILEADDKIKEYIGQALVEAVKQNSFLVYPNDRWAPTILKMQKRVIKEILYFFFKVAESQPNLFDRYVGEALIEVAKKGGRTEELAELLFAAGAGNSIHIGEALSKASKIENVDFLNVFFKNLLQVPQVEES